jgi:hypothetical protein
VSHRCQAIPPPFEKNTNLFINNHKYAGLFQYFSVLCVSFSNIILINVALLWVHGFHLNFKMSMAISESKWSGILIGIVLILYIKLEQNTIWWHSIIRFMSRVFPSIYLDYFNSIVNELFS